MPDVWGAAFGDPDGTHIIITDADGIRIRSGTTNKFHADPSGNLAIVGNLAVGTGGVIRSGATAYGTGTGYWLAYNGGTPQMRVGNPSGDQLAWDGSTLTISAANIGIGQAVESNKRMIIRGSDTTSSNYVLVGTDSNGAITFSSRNDGEFYVQGGAIFSSSGDPLRIQVSNVDKVRFDANGDLRPETDNTQHVGVPSKRFAYMTALAFNTTDVQLENGWAFTESYRIGIDQPGVALVNDKGSLIAFFGEDQLYTKPIADVDTLKYHVTTLAERLEMDPTPEIRVKGYDADWKPIYKTVDDVRPMPDPASATTNRERATTAP